MLYMASTKLQQGDTYILPIFESILQTPAHTYEMTIPTSFFGNVENLKVFPRKNYFRRASHLNSFIITNCIRMTANYKFRRTFEWRDVRTYINIPYFNLKYCIDCT